MPSVHPTDATLSSGLSVKGTYRATAHLAAILAVFTDTTKNQQWNTALTTQSDVITAPAQNRLALQVYALPWPLADREFLLKCHNHADHATHTFTSTCASVDDASVPVGDGRVRGQLHHSEWIFTALSDGGTRIDFESTIDPMGDLPKWVVSAGQQLGKNKLVVALLDLQERLGLPPLEEYADWGSKGGAAAADATEVGERVQWPQVVQELAVDLLGKAARSLSSVVRDLQKSLPPRLLVPGFGRLPRWQYDLTPTNSLPGEYVHDAALTAAFIDGLRLKLANPLDEAERTGGAPSAIRLMSAVVAGMVAGLVGRSLSNEPHRKLRRVRSRKPLAARYPPRSFSHAQLSTLSPTSALFMPRRCSSLDCLQMHVGSSAASLAAVLEPC